MDDERGAVSLVPTSRDDLTEHERVLIARYRSGTLQVWPAAMDNERDQTHGLARLALAATGLLLGTLLVLGLTLGVLTVVSAVTATGQAVSGVGARAESAVDGIGAAIGGAVHGLAERIDPTLPPRGPLALDTEFVSVRQVAVGATLGETGSHLLTVEAIRWRAGATSPDSAQYAVISGRLKEPRETRILGVLAWTDDGATAHYLDKGETFRVGGRLYKVNWISAERGVIAIAEYREPDRATVAVDFAYDE